MAFLTDLQSWLHGGVAGQLKSVAADIEPAQLAVAMAVAAAFGAVHAFMPGHGKTVIVSYYLGRPSGLLGSIASSAILVATHVGSAIVLVLAGFAVVRSTIGGAGRAPGFELASAALIVAVGLWLLLRAVRPHDHAQAGTDAQVLAFVTGLVPCPLTTFIMVYASVHGIIGAGLFVTASMAAGMLATIALFAIASVVLRARLVPLLERTVHIRANLVRGLEIASAAAIIAFGVWLLATR